MNLAQDCLGEMFVDVKNLVHELAWRSVRSYGGNFDEAKSVAYLAFCQANGRGRYDRTISQLTTWTHFTVWKALQTAARRQARRDAKARQVPADLSVVPRRHEFDVEAFADDLSDDARTVVLLLVDLPRPTRAALVNCLRKMGWPADRVGKSFTEIQGAL